MKRGKYAKETIITTNRMKGELLLCFANLLSSVTRAIKFKHLLLVLPPLDALLAF